MLSFLGLGKKKQSDSSSRASVDGNTDMVVRTNSSTTLATTAPEYSLVGIGAVDQSCLMKHLPEKNFTNVIVTVNFASSVTSTVGTLLSDQAPTPMSRTQFITSTLSWGLSVGAQLLKFFENFNKLQEAQHDVINNLPITRIDSCFSESAEGTVVLEDEITPQSIIEFTRAHGKATLQFDVPGVKLDLYDFGICTKRVGGKAAIAGVATVSTQMINIGYFLAQQAGMITDEQASVLQLTANVTTNLPLISIAGKLSTIYNSYTENFKRQLDGIIIKLYQEPKLLHDLPPVLLDVAGRFLSEKDRKENLKRMGVFIKEARDLEAGNPRLSSAPILQLRG